MEGPNTVSDVPSEVFKKFIEALGTQVSADVVARLQKTLLVDRKYSDKAIKDALFPEVFDL